MTGAWQRLSLRARLMLIGLIGLATALALGSVVLYTVLSVVSYRSLDSASRSTAHEVAGLVQASQLPDPIPVTGAQIVQVVDPRDRVASASVNADRLTSLLQPGEVRAALRDGHVDVPGSRVGVASPLRVAAARVEGGGGRTVLVAQAYEDILHSQRTLRLTLLATYPLLLAVLGLIAWRVIGAALSPVEALRASADTISDSLQDARLPVPASRDEIHRLAVTLNGMLDRLAASRARQRMFVADAAHELRSPLASMQTQIDVWQRVEGPSRELTDLAEEVRRMTRLVGDLLVLARLDARAERVDTEPVDVAAVATEAAARTGRVPVVALSNGADDPVVNARPDELRRIIGNLVDNAVRHAHSRVTITTYRDSGSVVVDVTDDGAGIRDVDRQRVFERFTRLDEARDRDAGGSGLGLAIVSELTQLRHGTIELRDGDRGDGLTARLRFPSATPGSGR